MSASGLRRVIALDGGTTNTRARLLIDGRVVASARRPLGVRDSVLSDAQRPLAEAVRGVIEEVLGSGTRPDAVVAAGMLTSEVGLVAVPHVPTPAGLDELAIGCVRYRLPEVCDEPILFVPGVRTPPGDGPDGWTSADVMRGEECETLGTLRLLGLTGPAALLWPGSHTKLVAVDAEGRITASHTTLAGELTAALARHTLLTASLPATLPDRPDADAVAAGARAVETSGIGRAAFLVRVAALGSRLTAERRAAFLVGAVVADDVRHLSQHAILEGGMPVWVGGSEPQRSLYAGRLASNHAGPVLPLDDDTAAAASAVGAFAVATRRAELASGH